MRDRYFGKYRGEVLDVEDPQARGRLRARVPDVLGDALSGWALPCAPFAGDGVGFFALPEPGSRVWVEFEGGDPSRPIWSGGWWRQGQAPGSAGELVLSDAYGNRLRLTGSGIEVQDAGGNKVVTGPDGVMVSSANGIVVGSATDTELRAGGDVTVEAVNISARAEAQIEAEGGAGAEISSGAQTVVKGAVVKIN